MVNTKYAVKSLWENCKTGNYVALTVATIETLLLKFLFTIVVPLINI